MTPAEHYAEAERLAADCVDRDGYAPTEGPPGLIANTIAVAQVHATLALVPEGRAVMAHEAARDEDETGGGRTPTGPGCAVIVGTPELDLMNRGLAASPSAEGHSIRDRLAGDENLTVGSESNDDAATWTPGGTS